MITEEEIKNLKPGDPLIIHGTFEKIYEDGDIAIEVMVTELCGDEVVKDTVFAHSSCVSLPSVKPIEMFHITYVPETYPKYDPCRLFRGGDKVTPRLVNGRDFNSMAEEYRGKILTVTRDEEKYDNVFVEYGGDEFTIDPAYLELVTTVEELEPYSIDPKNTNVLFKHGKKFAVFEDDDEAQELCDRLNAEHRKEQA